MVSSCGLRLLSLKNYLKTGNSVLNIEWLKHWVFLFGFPISTHQLFIFKKGSPPQFSLKYFNMLSGYSSKECHFIQPQNWKMWALLAGKAAFHLFKNGNQESATKRLTAALSGWQDHKPVLCAFPTVKISYFYNLNVFQKTTNVINPKWDSILSSTNQFSHHVPF